MECVWRRHTDGFDVYVGDLQCADARHCQPNSDSDGDFRGRRHEIGVRQRNSDASSNGHNDLASDGRYGWRGVLSSPRQPRAGADCATGKRARCLAQYLAGVSSRAQRTETTAVERVFPGREFCSRQKGGAGVGKTKRGKGTKWMVVVDGQGLPLGKHLCSASPHETRLAETTLATICVGRRTHAGRPRQKPLRPIADRGYDSDPLRARLAKRGIELIAPHRWNRSKPVTQDGRALRRYRRRWKVERTFAWLGNFRHLAVRYDRSLTIYSAFFHIACFIIVLRRVLK